MSEAPRSSVWPGWWLAAAVAVLAAGLNLPLTDGDTALYATVARDALARGEWVAYTFRDGRVFDKPPLTLWLLQVSIAAFGTAEWAVRLWHLALALATAGATYRVARLVLPVRESLLAAVVLLTSAQFFYQALVPQQDVPLTLFVALAVYGYLRWEADGRVVWAVVAGVAAGLAVLSKGLVGVVLPALVAGTRLVVDRPRPPARWPVALAVAAAACLAVAAPWFVAAGLRQGREFVETFFGGGTLGVGRFFRPALSAPGWVPAAAGLFAYAVFLPLGLLPWTGWLWPALREGLRARDRVLRVCFLWVVAVLVFLSVSPGDKVIRFLLPVFPPASVLLASVVSDPRRIRGASAVSLAAGGLLTAALVTLAAAPLPAEVTPFRPVAAALLLPLAGGLAVSSLLLRTRAGRSAVPALAAAALAGYSLLLVATARQWDRMSPWRPVARMVEVAAAEDTHVLVEGEPTPFAWFYIRRPVRFVSRDGLAAEWTSGRVVAVMPVDMVAALPGPPVVVGGAPGGLVVVKNY